MNSTKQTNKFARFLRNNAALLIVIFCVVAITTVVLCVTLIKPDETVTENKPVVVNPDPSPKPDETDKPQDNTPVLPQFVKVYFEAPVDFTGVTMEYTSGSGDALFVFNNTVEAWQTHKALDLAAADGSAVKAMYDGKVTEVFYTYGMGNTVKIDHGNKVVATYASLGDVDVSIGDTVKKGDTIGTVSTTASFEYVDGAHLHLEIKENGVAVDPTPYVSGEIYRETEVTSNK